MSPLAMMLVAALSEPEVRAALREAVAGAAPAEWLTLDEAGQIAGVAPRVIRDAARRGELVLGRAGRRPIVRREVLDAWIASRAPAPRPQTVKDDPASDVQASLSLAAERLRRVK